VSKVGIIKSNYTPFGGGEKYAKAVIRAFKEKGYEVHVITASKDEWFEEGVKKIRIPMSKYNNFLRLYTFNKNCYNYMKKNIGEYEFVLDMDRTVLATHIRAGGGSHKAWLERRAVFSHFLKNLSFSVNPFHNYMLKIERKSLENPLLKALICNSYMVKEEFKKYYDYSENKIYVVYNGVEWRYFEDFFNGALDKKNIFKKDLELDSRFWLLFVGSGYERKGLSFVIEALSKVSNDICLAVVGKDRNEGYYKKKVNEKKLGDRVKFFGPRKDVIKFLQACDAFILPTIYDPFSNATLEALAMGLFTITSNANGCSEIISEGCGYVIKNLKDIEELVYGIEVATKNYDKRRIRNSVQEYDFENKLNELIDICIKTSRG
jgi:UDP-glucose:(heptosyl)LPS alpha-1,3-glucosyltransferase